MRRRLLALSCLLAAPCLAHADDFVTLTVIGTETSSYTGISQTDPSALPVTLPGPSQAISGTAQYDLDTFAISNYSFSTELNFDAFDFGSIELPSTASLDCGYDPSQYAVAVACLTSDATGFIYAYNSLPASIPIAGQDALGRITYTLNADFTPPSNAAVSPEPSAFALFGTGVLGMAGMLRRRSGVTAP